MTTYLWRFRRAAAAIALAGLALALPAAAAAAAQPARTLGGWVRDTAGLPVRGAMLQLGTPGDSTSSLADAVRTDSLGRFRVAVSGAGERTLRVRALGYAPQAYTFEASADAAPIEVVLERVTVLARVDVRALAGDWRVRRALTDIEYRAGRGLTRVADSTAIARWGGTWGALESIGVRHGPNGELQGVLRRPVCIIANGGLDGTAQPTGDVALLEYFASPSDGQPLDLQMQCDMDRRPRGLLIIWTKDFLDPGFRRRR